MTDLQPAPPRFVDLLHSEWTKIRTLRSTGYTLLATAVVGIGFAVLFSFAAVRTYTTGSPDDRAAFDPTAVSLRSYLLAQLAVGVLGVLVLTSEYATGMIRASVTAAPRRSHLLAAKAVVFGLVGLVAGEVVGLGAFLAGQAILAAHHVPHTDLGAPGVLRAVLGMGCYLAAVGLLGVGLGTLLRSTAGGLSVLVTVTLLVPVFVPALPTSWAEVVEKYWPTLAGQRIMTVRAGTDALAPWAGFGLLCACVAGTGLAAYAVFRRRDV